MSPANAKPIRPWAPDRHIDINADLHYFFDWLMTGKTILDVGAGLGKSKARIRHSKVTTYDPSPAVAGQVDLAILPLQEHVFVDAAGRQVSTEPFDVVTAFEVIEHVEDDMAFLRTLDALAGQAIFLTTPNWAVSKCQSADHYREYTHAEWEELICGAFPSAIYWWGAFFKDSHGGWCELLDARRFRVHHGLKHLVLVEKRLSDAEEQWLAHLEVRGHVAVRGDRAP